MRTIALATLHSLAVAFLLAACSGSHSAADPTLPTVQSDLSITVSSGTTPTISWSGGMASSFAVTDMSVTNFTTGGDVWDFYSQGAGVTSPVRYGTMPTNSECTFVSIECPTALPLVKGHTYLVTIITPNFVTGQATFTP